MITAERYCSGCGTDVIGRGRDACTCPGGPTFPETHTAPDGGKPVTRETHTSHTSHTHVKEEEPEKTQEEQDAELLAGIRNGTWLSEQTFPPLRWAVPGLVPEGLSLLIGPPKAGKSWLVVDWLLAAAAGGYALGTIPLSAKRPVLYLALEDGDRRMQSRCRAVYGTDEQLPENYHYVTRIPPGAVIAYITAFLRRHPDTAMVVLDTLGKVMPDARMGESSYQRDYRVGGALKGIADDHPGLALVVVHHDRKAASDDFVDSVSGTNGLAGSADTIMVLARKRKSLEALLKVTGRDVPEEEYALKLEGGVHWDLDGGDLAEAAEQASKREETQSISDRSSEIIDHVRKKARPVKASEITEAFGKSAAEYLRRHTESGRLVKTGRGLYTVPAFTDEGDSHTGVRSVRSVSFPGQGATAKDGHVQTCEVCREPMTVIEPGQTTHPMCREQS